MSRWQRHTRLVIAVFGVVFAVFVWRELRHRDSAPASAPVARTDPKAIVETTGGELLRFKGSREDVRVASEKQLTYAATALTGAGVDVRIFSLTRGDAYSRYLVRVAEMKESVKICRQALERIVPTGAFAVADPRITPPPKTA